VKDSVKKVKKSQAPSPYLIVLYLHSCLRVSSGAALQFSASEVTTLWRYTNLFIIIIIISFVSRQIKKVCEQSEPQFFDFGNFSMAGVMA